MTAQRRRRSSLLLLSLVSCSATASAVGALAEPARNVVAVDEKASPTAGNKYRPSSEARNNKEKAEGRKCLRGIKHAETNKLGDEDEIDIDNINADQSQRIHDGIIDLAAPLFDKAVIPSPLESPNAGKNDHQEATSSTAERDLKKDKDDKKDDKNEQEIKNEVTIIEPKSHSIIGTGNTVYHVSAGVIDLTNPPIKIPPSTPAQCFETKPYMGCDRGGADNQRLVFFGRDFGLGCAQADPCLFALMPIRMAYYCPKQGRPVCGGKCYSVSQHCPADGIVVDNDGIGHNVTDTKWRDANAAAWNFWPANFGCPSCVS